MIPASRWRPVAALVVVASAVLVALAGAAGQPSLAPFAVPLIAVGVVWTLRRPGGWGPFALLALEVLDLAVSRGAPRTVTEWALAAVCGAALLGTHLAAALLASWPPRASLPGASARRWLLQGGVLASAGGLAAVVGVLGTFTPVAWGPWVATAALLLVGTAVVLVGVSVRRRG